MTQISASIRRNPAATRQLKPTLKITPTLITAALAGIFSALVWPFLWAKFGSSNPNGSMELIVSTLLVIALPAHAFVVGFGRDQSTGPRMIDTAMLKRIGAWLLAAFATVAVTRAFGA